MAVRFTRATDGPMMGALCVPFFTDRLLRFSRECALRKVGYELGAKDVKVGSGEVDFDVLDCSGYNRTLVGYAGPTMLAAGYVDGSYEEYKWLRLAGFKFGGYSDYVQDAGNFDGVIRIAFHHPGGRGGARFGHVWLTLNGLSYECYSPVGCGVRSSKCDELLSIVDCVFAVGVGV